MSPSLAAAITVLLLAASPAPASRGAFPSAVEFPPQDYVVWVLQREGLVATESARRLREAPDSVETVRWLAEAKDLDGLVRSLRLIVETRPRRIADAFEATERILWVRGGGSEEVTRTGQLRETIAIGRSKLQGLPREEAARAERRFTFLDGFVDPATRSEDRFARFIDRYHGTEAALLAQIDAISLRGVSQSMLDELERLASEHPRTVAAAKARHQMGFQWHSGNVLGTIVPRDADPIGRFRRVLAVVNDLDSGRYPRCEWVERAPALVTGFFIPRGAPIAPEHLNELRDTYIRFVRAHFAPDNEFPTHDAMGYLLTHTLPDLLARCGDPVAGTERVFAELEAGGLDRSALRFLHALFYLEFMRDHQLSPEERVSLLGKARDMLAALAARGHGLYHRKALATLAALDFREQRYAEAAEAYRRYASSYPRSNWRWLALLHLGQCEEALGRPVPAAEAYLRAAADHRDLPLARVLGRVYAARVFEASGRLDDALVEFERALAEWDNRFGVRYTTAVTRTPTPDGPRVEAVDAGEVRKEDLTLRIAALKQALAMPDGRLLEQARTLVRAGQYMRAIEVLRPLSGDPASSSAEARALTRLARLKRAIELADCDRADADESQALREFEALAADTGDFAGTAAAVAHASALVVRGEPARAEELLRTALTRWHDGQPWTPPSSGLEQDVADIRRTVFLPRGGPIYAGPGWNAFEFADAAQPFALVNADVVVQRHDGEMSRVTVRQPLAVAPSVLFFDTDQLRVLRSLLTRLGGRLHYVPQSIMATNLPAGDSETILRLWNRLFPARPGHWFGWEIEAYPVITEIRFLDEARTRSEVKVTIGYSGATVELEKRAGTWTPLRLTNRWIT